MSTLSASTAIALGLVATIAACAQENVPAVTIGAYPQEVSRSFQVDSGLPSDDVLAVTVTPEGSLLAATPVGLVEHQDGQWTQVDAIPKEPVRLLAAGPNVAYAATDNALYRMQLEDTKAVGGPLPADPTALAAAGDAVWLGTREGLYRLGGTAFAPEDDLNTLVDDPAIRDVAAAPDGRVAVAASSGLFLRGPDATWTPQYPRQGIRSWAPHDVRAVAFDDHGRLWFADPQGVGCLEAGEWTLYTGTDGLPYNDFTDIATGAGGVVWFGTRIGAIRYRDGQWAYREGRRWLPDNEVRSIALDTEGNTWFATPQGVGTIYFKPMTLAEKAKYFEDEIDKRHRRTPFGYVQSVILEQPGDKSKWRQRDDDNDGQYTGMYGAAECFAYAATKDPEAKRRATAAFEALAFFSEVTQGGTHPAPRGFPARTILPTDDPRNPNDEYTLEKDQKRRDTSDRLWKVMHPRWPVSADGKWYWKCDTSSDELDGHYYLYGRYYDLVAETEEEKERAREVVRRVTDHLLKHDCRLVDWDGTPTRWANFSPDSLNRDQNWWPERGLNSLSILGHLRVAEHVTGDRKYRRAADKLARKHAFVMNSMYPKNQRGPGSYVQFDDEMAFLNYYNVMAYEKDPELRQMLAYSCYLYWELEECERNAFYNFTYAACCQDEVFESPWGTGDLSPKQQCIEDAVDTLKRYPLDRISWRHTNSHRIDIVPLPAYARDPGEAEGCGYRVDGTVLPVDERHIHLWADDPWRLDTGGNGDSLVDGAAFLLAYYMGLYHGYIQEE